MRVAWSEAVRWAYPNLVKIGLMNDAHPLDERVHREVRKALDEVNMSRARITQLEAALADQDGVDLQLGRKVRAMMEADKGRHLIELREDDWTVQHPMRERLNGDLFSCGNGRVSDLQEQIEDYLAEHNPKLPVRLWVKENGDFEPAEDEQ